MMIRLMILIAVLVSAPRCIAAAPEMDGLVLTNDGPELFYEGQHIHMSCEQLQAGARYLTSVVKPIVEVVEQCANDDGDCISQKVIARQARVLFDQLKTIHERNCKEI